MTTTAVDNSIVEKTRELCQAILDNPDSQSLRRQIDTFMANDQAKRQYQELVEQGEHLHHKQHQGVTLTNDEVRAYEKLRLAAMASPVVKSFVEAQQEMQKIQDSVQQYVTKTLELGRVPQESDFDDGSCGHGCGCHH